MKKQDWIRELRASLAGLALLALLLCGAYPLVVWGLAQGVFPGEADGSLIREHGALQGSVLLAQGFSGAAYFHPRPSAAGQGYDGASSGGSNLGPTSRKLVDAVKDRVADYRRINGLTPEERVPADAVTASASGLDPHISVANALRQAPRVAKTRRMSEAAVRKAVAAHTEGRTFGLLGEPRVNVLRLNLDLDDGR